MAAEKPGAGKNFGGVFGGLAPMVVAKPQCLVCTLGADRKMGASTGRARHGPAGVMKMPYVGASKKNAKGSCDSPVLPVKAPSPAALRRHTVARTERGAALRGEVAEGSEGKIRGIYGRARREYRAHWSGFCLYAV